MIYNIIFPRLIVCLKQLAVQRNHIRLRVKIHQAFRKFFLPWRFTLNLYCLYPQTPRTASVTTAQVFQLLVSITSAPLVLSKLRPHVSIHICEKWLQHASCIHKSVEYFSWPKLPEQLRSTLFCRFIRRGSMQVCLEMLK